MQITSEFLKGEEASTGVVEEIEEIGEQMLQLRIRILLTLGI